MSVLPYHAREKEKIPKNRKTLSCVSSCSPPRSWYRQSEPISSLLMPYLSWKIWLSAPDGAETTQPWAVETQVASESFIVMYTTATYVNSLAWWGLRSHVCEFCQVLSGHFSFINIFSLLWSCPRTSFQIPLRPSRIRFWPCRPPKIYKYPLS